MSVTFTITVNDPPLLAGLKAAREGYNKSLPLQVDKNGVRIPRDQLPGYMATDEAYLIARVMEVLQKYAKQYGLDAEAIATMQAELDERKARLASITTG